jgi:Divergent InlB B-repeat domain/WD40-like Beta Propeller Repeat
VKDLRLKPCLLWGLIFAALVVWVAGCEQQINFPTPIIKSISPTETQAGEPTFNLTVAGKGFTPSSSVMWSSETASATLVSTYDPNTGELVAQVPASYIESPGQAYISVSTPQPGGGVTSSLTFTINPNPSAVPAITGLSPGAVAAGSSGLTLTINGKNFVAKSVVLVNGNARSTSFSNSTTLQATITGGDVGTAGTLQVSVFNPPPDGGSSNAFGFDVDNPVPSLASLSPTTALAGSVSASLVLTGTNYNSQSVVLVNGAPRTTTFGSATQLGATLNAGDLAQGGVVQVQVENPGPGGGTSNIQTFAIDPSDIAGLPDLVDYAYNGAEANNGICGTLAACSNGTPSLSTSGPSISTSGQYVAFASISTNLLQNQANAASAIFVRDTCLSGTASSSGSSGCVPHTVLVNLGVDGALPNGPAEEPTIDSAGAHVAYTSTATNLVSYSNVSGTNRQVYWQSTCLSGSSSTGCSTTGSNGTAALVSVGADGVTPGNGDSYDPVISPDGEYVAFVSLATNLVSGVTVDGVTPQVYVRNTCNVVPPATGSCTPTTYLVSTPDGTTPGNGASSAPSIANDGLFVSFTSQAGNLLGSGSRFNGTAEVFERSTCLTTLTSVGGTCVPATTLISSPDQVTPADGASGESSVSQDGRFVAFASAAKNLIPGIGPTQQVYVSDTCAGVAATTPPQCTPSLTLVSTPDGTTPANALAENPSVNQCVTSTSVTVSCGTGQFIAFATKATNLGPNVQNGVENVFARNTCEGVITTTTTTTPNTPDCVAFTFLASQPQGTQASPANGDSIVPSLSGDGHVVGFLSSATNLVSNDTNGIPDAFIANASPLVGLTVSLQGSGSGKVTDGQSQIDCVLTTGAQTGTCSANYVYGSTVTLTATASSGYTFTSWGGAVTTTTCPSTTDTCTVTLVTPISVTASFK